MSMGRVEGKVAFITGAARGQGRAHAVRLAEEGAHIVAVDALGSYSTVAYPMATQEDLDETVRLVEGLDRRILARQADVRRHRRRVRQRRDRAARAALLGDVRGAVGRLSGRQPQRGLAHLFGGRSVDDRTRPGRFDHRDELRRRPVGRPPPRRLQLVEDGVIGLMRTMANELARHYIRVNAICPTVVDTPMVQNDQLYRLFRPDLDDPQQADVIESFRRMNAMPEPWIEPVDVSNAVLWLASDEARYVTGVALPVDLGSSIKM
jgi:(+)-trans-carveol dehydrogenase